MDDVVRERTMANYGYIFIGEQQGQNLDEDVQTDAINAYAKSTLQGEMTDFFIEEGASLKGALRERRAGRKLFERCGPGDSIVTMKVEHILGSASEASRLVSRAKKQGIAIHCVDLGGNISLDEKRRLAVFEGNAAVIDILLKALALCESSRHGDAIRAAKKTRKEEGKYLGGPVPFGWQVNRQGYLVEFAEQQKIIRRIRKLREQRWSYRDISKSLKSDYDVQLSHEGVRRILLGDEKKKGDNGRSPRKTRGKT